MSKFETFTASAADALNAGFTSKAGQKVALDFVSRAYETLTAELKAACLATPRIDAVTGKLTPAVEAVYWDVPSYPHQFKAKHSDLIRAAFGNRFDALIANAFALVELRETIKGAAIVPPAKDETKAVAVRISETIKAEMERLGVRYLEAIDLCEAVGDGVIIKGLSSGRSTISGAS
jgi:hypothetical protein